MKHTLLTICLIFFSLNSWSEDWFDLVERNDLFYQKFTNTPFTGKVSGIMNGQIKNGKMVGEWLLYWESGQLNAKSTFKDGVLDGFYEDYNQRGQLVGKRNYKNGKQDGLWEYLNEDGSLKKTETWKDGKLISCEGGCE